MFSGRGAFGRRTERRRVLARSGEWLHRQRGAGTEEGAHALHLSLEAPELARAELLEGLHDYLDAASATATSWRFACVRTRWLRCRRRARTWLHVSRGGGVKFEMMADRAPGPHLHPPPGNVRANVDRR